MDLTANGSITPLSGGFDLTFEGGTDGLAIGNDRLDPLLAGQTTLSGRAVRDETGIRTENLRIANPQVALRLRRPDLQSTQTDIDFNASLTDLALLDPRLGGAMTASGHAQGKGQPIDV